MMAGFLTTNQLLGPAIGAPLFAAGMAVAVRRAGGAASALGVVLIARMRLPPVKRSGGAVARAGATSREGFRVDLGNPPVRTLTLTIVTFNVTFGAAWSVLVLYATERLASAPVGFGLLTTVVRRRRARRHASLRLARAPRQPRPTSCASG